MQRKYHKMLKKEGLNSTQNSAIGDGASAVPKGTNVKKTPGFGRKTSLDRASDVYSEKLAAKNKQEDDLATQKKEREEAMSKYRENKAAKVYFICTVLFALRYFDICWFLYIVMEEQIKLTYTQGIYYFVQS